MCFSFKIHFHRSQINARAVYTLGYELFLQGPFQIDMFQASKRLAIAYFDDTP